MQKSNIKANKIESNSASQLQEEYHSDTYQSSEELYKNRTLQNESMPYSTEKNQNQMKQTASFSKSSSQQQGIKNGVYSPKQQSHVLYAMTANQSIKNSGNFKISKPSEVRRTSYDQQQIFGSNKQLPQSSGYQGSRVNRAPEKGDSAQTESTFQSAIWILKRNIDNDQQVQLLEKQLRGEDDSDNFELIIRALNDAALEYLEIKEKQKASQIINFAYETCVIEHVPLEMQAETMLNYCHITKANNDYNNSILMLNKCINLSQEQPLLVNLGVVYSIYSAILRRQNKSREALEMAKKGLFQSEQRLKQIMKQIEIRRGSDEELENQNRFFQLQIAQNQYYLALCEVEISNKKAAVILLQTAINKVVQIQGKDHPTVLKYQQKLNQIQSKQVVQKDKEEKFGQSVQNDSHSSGNSGVTHKRIQSNQSNSNIVTFNVEQEYNNILNKNSGALNHRYNNYLDVDDSTPTNNKQRSALNQSNNGNSQTMRIGGSLSRPQSSKSSTGNKISINRKNMSNIVNDQNQNIKFILKQSESQRNSQPFMYQDFASTSTQRVRQNDTFLGRQPTNGKDYFQEQTENQQTHKIIFLQDTVSSLKQEVEKLKRQNGYLSLKLMDSENTSSKISSQSKQVANLSASMEELQRKVKEYKDKVEKCEKEHPAEIDKLSSTLKERSDVLRRVLEKNQNEVNTYEEKISKMKIEEEKKQRLVNDQICTLELTNTKNQLQISSLKNDLKTTQENHAAILQSKEKEIRTLSLQLQQKETSYTSELEKYQNNQNQVSQLTNQIKSLEQQLKQLREDKEIVDQSLQRQRSQMSEMNAELTSTQDKLSQQNTLIKGKDIEIAQLQEINQKQSQLASQAANAPKLQEQLEKEKKDHTTNLNRVNEENKRLQNLLKEAQREIDEKEKLLESQKSSKADEQLNHNLQQENSELKDNLTSLQKKNEEITAQLAQEHTQNEQYKTLLTQLNSEIQAKEEKLRDFESNFSLIGHNNKTVLYSEEGDLHAHDLVGMDKHGHQEEEKANKYEMDDSIGDIQKSLEVHTNKNIHILQQFDKKLNALFDFQFNCPQHELVIERKRELLFSVSIHDNILQLFYTSKNFFIFSKILRRFANSFLSHSISNEEFAEEFIFDVDEMSFKYSYHVIKFDNSYVKHLIKDLPQQIQRSFLSYAFYSNETSDQKLIEITQIQSNDNSKSDIKKTISFGEALVLCDHTKEKVPIRFIYDVKKQNLLIEPSSGHIQGMKVPIKKEDAQQWIVQNKIISLDKQLRAIKMQYVKQMKSSIKRYHLLKGIFLTNISVTYQDQKVQGVLNIFKGIKNSFIYIKTLHKEKNYKCFYQISMNHKPFEKLVEISKQYIIDQCQFNYEKGIQWIKNSQNISIYPSLNNVVHQGLIQLKNQEISAIRQLRGLNDESVIRDEESYSFSDIIQVVVTKESDKLFVKPLWDLPIKPFSQSIQNNETDEELKLISIFLINQENKQLYMLQGSSKESSDDEENMKPTNIYKLDCLNTYLRKSQNNRYTQHLKFIDTIEVPDHTAKSTCKLQIIQDTQTNEYIIRSFHKQVHDLKFPAFNLSKEKLLNLYYFYYEQFTIKFIKKQMLERVVFQMRKFKMINKLKFYQIKTKTGQYGDLLLFQGLHSTMIIVKIMYTSQKDVLRKLFVIQKTSLEQIIENINEIIKIINQHIVNIYSVLTYRQVENQDFKFFNVAALWDQQNKEIIIKADDLSIPTVVFKKQKLSYKQALFQGEELLQQAILYKDPLTGLNQIDI